MSEQKNRIDKFIDKLINQIFDQLEEYIFNKQKFEQNIKETLKNEICYDLYGIIIEFIACYENEQNKIICAEKLYSLAKELLS